MKTICIFHEVDLDGWMSAAIVQYWFNEQKRNHLNSKVFKEVDVDFGTLDFIGYNYGQPIPDLSEYDKVIMCDISFKLTKGQEIDRIAPMFNLIDKFKSNFIWIDHHISAMNDVAEYANEYDYDVSYPIGIRDTKFAACELTWKYFFSNPIDKYGELEEQNPMPEIVRLLGRYDCFGHKGTDEEQKVLEFQYGARSAISNPEDAYQALQQSLNSKHYEELNLQSIEMELWDKGEAIYNYLCTEARSIYAAGFPVTFQEPVVSGKVTEGSTGFMYDRKFLCINRERFNPVNFGIDYHAGGYDGCACFWYDGKQWKFSLYNDNGLVDCSAIAKQYGGGGHAGAAGMVLNYEQFTSLIKQ